MMILKIVTNKWTYITLFLTIIAVVISILFVRGSIYKAQTEKLNIEIENLKITNSVLIKDIEFQKTKAEIINNFSNTTEQIKIIKSEELNNEVKNILLNISNNYYFCFTN